MKDYSDQDYDSLGYCMYCGSTENLEDEHPMPYALGGQTKFPNSSCQKCARITGAVEQDVLRGPMRNVRIHREIQSRSNHESAPEELTVSLVKGEENERVELPRENCPVLFGFPLFLKPGELRKENYESGIQMIGFLLYSFGRTPDEVADEQDADSLVLEQEYNPSDFARMIAKIAYSVTAAEEGLEMLDTSPVVSSILGKENSIGRWVGTLDVNKWLDVITPKPRTESEIQREATPVSKVEELHEVKIYAYRFGRKNYLVGAVRLFADAATPAYGVLLGEMK